MSHLEEFKIVFDIQHGFLKSHSCETQLLITLEDLARNIDHDKQSDIILLDFAKAFDSVPHQRLHDIEGVERRGARFVKNCYEREPGTLTNPLNDLNWHSLELRRKIARLITMYKMVNNKVRVNIPEYIARPTRVTRSYHSIKFMNIGIVTAIPISTFFFYENSKRMKHATFLFIRSALCGRI